MQHLKKAIKHWILQEPQPFGTVVSFPKSGRTWLRVMLDKLAVGMVYTHAGSEYTVSCHFNDLPVPRPRSGPGQQLLLLRDPRDTVVSGYFQKSKRKKQDLYSGDLSEFIRDPRYGIEKILRFNLAWLTGFASMDFSTHRSVSYEAIRSDPIGAMTTIYTYLKGQPPNPLSIQSVVEEASFSRMQAQERSGELGAQYGSILTPADASDPESMKVRKGKIGGYKDYLNQADIDFCNSILSSHKYESTVFDHAALFLA